MLHHACRLTAWLWPTVVSMIGLNAAGVDTSGRVVQLETINPGVSFVGDGLLKVTSNVWLATSAEVAPTEFAMVGGSIVIEPGCILVNGGWQKGNWSGNKADLHLSGTLDLWDGHPVFVNALDGTGTIRFADQGTWWTGTKRIHVGVNGGGGTFSGPILRGNTDRSIEFIKEGNGLQTLNNLDQQTPGSFVINAGTLRFSTESNATNSAGTTGAGSLVKSGQGRLTLSGTLAHLGTTTVEQGTLRLTAGSAGNSAVRNTLVVNPDATVVFADDGTGLGFNGGSSARELKINGGLVTASGNLHVWNLAGGVSMTGGVLQSNGGVSTPTGPELEWGNTVLTTFPSTQSAVIAGRIRIRHDSNPFITFNVAEGPAMVDLDITAAITQSGGKCGLIKQGPGTLRISGALLLDGAITVEGGTLDVSGATLGTNVKFNVSGDAVLRLSSTSVPNAIFAAGEKLRPGTWGAPGSVAAGTATNESSIFTGSPTITLSNSEPSARERWKSMHYGMLVHYVWGGSGLETRNLDGSPAASLEAVADGFDVQGFADDLASTGVEYVIFTAWHSNFIPLFNSAAVMNNFGFQRNSSRDVVGEMISAVRAKGIRVLLYTNIGQVSVFYDNRWNDVMEDIFAEMLDRYEIDGFFMDENDPGGNMSWDFPRIARAIHLRKPDAVTIQNFYGNLYTWDGAVGESGPADLNLSNNVMWTAGSPYAQVISQTWSAQVAKVPAPITANRRSAEGIYRATVLAAGSRTEGGGILWSAGPFVGNGTWFNPATNQTEFVGRWEHGVLEAMQGAGAYITPVAESIKGVLPSNSWRPQGFISNLPWGVATRKPDDSREYIHVLNPPAGKTLALPAPNDGKVFGNARLLPSNKPVTLVQTPQGVALTLASSDEWDPLNTVIAMDVIAQGGRGITNDDSPAVTYSGTSWTHQTNRSLGDYGDDAHVATANGDGLNFTFSGTEVEMFASRGRTHGVIEVFLDGVSQGAINLHSSVPVSRTTVFSKAGLARKLHTLQVVKLSGSELVIDAFKVTESLNGLDPDVSLAALSNYNNTQTTPNGVGHVAYGPGWFWQQRDWTEFNSDIHYAASDGAEAVIHFNGTGIIWEGNSQGVVDFYLDGVFVKQTHMGALGGRSNQVGFHINGLPPGNHTLRFVKAGGMYVEFDNFRVYNDVNGQWSSAQSSSSMGGDLHSTPKDGDLMSVTFNGHSADVISRKGPDGGTAWASVDPTNRTAMNQYRSIADNQVVSYSTLTTGLLTPGKHTLQMVKNRGNRMFFDALRIHKQWPLGSQAPNLLISDSFDSPSYGASEFNSTLAADQRGFLAPLTYSITGQSENYKIQHGNGGRLLMAAWHGGQSLDLRASLNHDFSGDANAADMPLKIGFDLKVTDASHPTNWAAIAIGSAQNAFITNSSNKFGALFRQNGGTQQFASGTDVSRSVAWRPSGSSIEVIVSDGAGHGSPFNGKGSVVRMFVNGALASTHAIAQLSAGDGFVSLEGFGAFATIDQLSVTLSLPPPASTLNDREIWSSSFNLTGGPDDDDDQDGASNALEYAFGLDPNRGDSTSPHLTHLNPENGKITYSRRRVDLSGLEFTIQVSHDLTEWSADPGAVQTATVIPGTDNESVEVTLSPENLNASRLFIRIKAR